MLISPGAIDGRSRDRRRRRLLPRVAREDLRAALGLYAKGDPVDAITLTDQLERPASSTPSAARVRLYELVRARPRDRELRHYARIVHETATLRGLIRDRPARSRASAGSARARPPISSTRPSRSLRALAAARHRRMVRDRVAAEGELRAHHRAVRVGRRPHRHAVGIPRPRPADLRLPARQPHHRRGAPVDGEVGARALHRRQHGRAAQRPRRPLHARDVEVGSDAAAHVQRGEGRVAAPAQRQARSRTTGRGSRQRATSSRRRRSTSTTPAS